MTTVYVVVSSTGYPLVSTSSLIAAAAVEVMAVGSIRRGYLLPTETANAQTLLKISMGLCLAN